MPTMLKFQLLSEVVLSAEDQCTSRGCCKENSVRGDEVDSRLNVLALNAVLID